MLKIEIYDNTPANMLRAIRAACNELLGETHADLTTQAAQHNSRAEELRIASERELDKSAACLTAHETSAGVQILEDLREASRGEETVLGAAFDKAIEVTDAPAVAQSLVEPTPAVEMDSAGAEWNPELHASTKAKNQDGTWKKRRGSAQQQVGTDSKQEVEEMLAEEHSAPPALPPLPPTPPAAPLVTMNDIYALISGGKCVLNDVIAAAQAMGFSDVGAFSRDATPEQRAQLLAQLTKEA